MRVSPYSTHDVRLDFFPGFVPELESRLLCSPLFCVLRDLSHQIHIKTLKALNDFIKTRNARVFILNHHKLINCKLALYKCYTNVLCLLGNHVKYLSLIEHMRTV